MYAPMYFVWARNARARVCVRVSARVTHAILKIPYFFHSEFFLDFFRSRQQTKNKYRVLILRRVISFQNDIINIPAAILD